MSTIPAPSRAPVRKVRYAGIAGAAVVIGTAIADASTKVRLPASLVAAAAVLAAIGTAYLTAAGVDELPVQQAGVRDDGLVHGPGPDWLGE